MKLANNTIYAPEGNVVVVMSGDSETFEKFQNLGFDPTSKVSADVPSVDEIAKWCREKLSF